MVTPAAPPGVHEAGAAGRAKTDRRRIAQPLLSALDAHLGPSIERGALLAVSGGPDSRALLEACARWPRRFEGLVHVASVDHATKTSSRAEAEAVIARARVLGFDGSVLSLAIHGHGDDEASLRDARYRALCDRARLLGLDVVVTAHHEGDVAEGALMSWLGQGGTGAAMRSTSTSTTKAFPSVVVRPFLELSRATIREALWAWGASDDVIIDSETRSLRARLRRDELAVLGAGRGDVERALARSARRARDDDDALEAAAAQLIVDDVTVRFGPAALMRRALRKAYRAALHLRATPKIAADGDVRSSARALEVILDLMRRGTPGEVHLTGAVATVTRNGADGAPEVRIRAWPRTVAEGTPPTHDGLGTLLSQAHPLVTVTSLFPTRPSHQEEDS